MINSQIRIIFFFKLFLFLTLAVIAQQPKNVSDEQLPDIVQKQIFRYFWDFGHPVSGLSRERSNKSYDYGDEVVTTGGTGFGIMAIVVATEGK